MEDDKPKSPKKQYSAVNSRLLMPTANQKNNQWIPKEKIEENKWKVSLSAAGAIKDQPDTYSVPKSLENVQSRLYAPTMASISGSVNNNKEADESKSKSLAFGSTYKGSSASSIHRPSNDIPSASPRTGSVRNSLVGNHGNSEPNFLRPTKAFIESQYHKAPPSNDLLEGRNKSTETLTKKINNNNNSHNHSTTTKSTSSTENVDRKNLDLDNSKTSSSVTHKKANDKAVKTTSTTATITAALSPTKKVITSVHMPLAEEEVKPIPVTKASLKNTLNLSATKTDKAHMSVVEDKPDILLGTPPVTAATASTGTAGTGTANIESSSTTAPHYTVPTSASALKITPRPTDAVDTNTASEKLPTQQSARKNSPRKAEEPESVVSAKQLHETSNTSQPSSSVSAKKSVPHTVVVSTPTAPVPAAVTVKLAPTPVIEKVTEPTVDMTEAPVKEKIAAIQAKVERLSLDGMSVVPTPIVKNSTPRATTCTSAAGTAGNGSVTKTTPRKHSDPSAATVTHSTPTHTPEPSNNKIFQSLSNTNNVSTSSDSKPPKPPVVVPPLTEAALLSATKAQTTTIPSPRGGDNNDSSGGVPTKIDTGRSEYSIVDEDVGHEEEESF